MTGERGIEAAEQWFRRRGLPAVVLAVPVVDRVGLDLRRAAVREPAGDRPRPLHRPVEPADRQPGPARRRPPRRPGDGRSQCVDQWLDSYLAGLALPPEGTVCAADRGPFDPQR